jgi:hypothetical protein
MIYSLFIKSWGGKENGLDLVKCCCYTELSNFPLSATAVNFEYTVDSSSSNLNESINNTKSIITKHVRLEKVHLVNKNLFFFF